MESAKTDTPPPDITTRSIIPDLDTILVRSCEETSIGGKLAGSVPVGFYMWREGSRGEGRYPNLRREAERLDPDGRGFNLGYCDLVRVRWAIRVRQSPRESERFSVRRDAGGAQRWMGSQRGWHFGHKMETVPGDFKELGVPFELIRLILASYNTTENTKTNPL